MYHLLYIIRQTKTVFPVARFYLRNFCHFFCFGICAFWVRIYTYGRIFNFAGNMIRY